MIFPGMADARGVHDISTVYPLYIQWSPYPALMPWRMHRLGQKKTHRLLRGPLLCDPRPGQPWNLAVIGVGRLVSINKWVIFRVQLLIYQGVYSNVSAAKGTGLINDAIPSGTSEPRGLSGEAETSGQADTSAHPWQSDIWWSKNIHAPL